MKQKITESQLRYIIAESIKQNLSETGYGNRNGRIGGYNGDISPVMQNKIDTEYGEMAKRKLQNMGVSVEDAIGQAKRFPRNYNGEMPEIVRLGMAILKGESAKACNVSDYDRFGNYRGHAIFEDVKMPDISNAVPQSVAEKYGFTPEYRCNNGYGIWGKTINPKSAKGLMAALGISNFTSYNTDGKVRITVKLIDKQTNEYVSGYSIKKPSREQTVKQVLFADVERINWSRYGTDTEWAAKANSLARETSKRWGLTISELETLHYGLNYDYSKGEEFNKIVNKAIQNWGLNKNTLYTKITESRLKDIVAESINKILNEIGDTQRGQYALGAVCARAKKEERSTNKEAITHTQMLLTPDIESVF